MTLRPRWVVILLIGLPALLSAYAYETSDVQNALQRHDLRKLESIATDAEKLLRQEALESLIQLKDPQTLPFLVSQLDDSDPDIVQSVLWGLPAFGAPAASPETLARVEEAQQNVSIDVRKTAVTVLEDLHDPEKLQQMHQAIISKDSDQHKDALAFYIQRKDLSILREAGAMLQDADPFIKQTGILLIHGLDDRDRLDAVSKLLKDPAPTVRATAAWVLGEWKESSAMELLSPLLKDTDPLVRGSVIAILGKHQTPEISTALAGLTQDKVPQVRIALAKALTQFASPASANGLLALALDDNPLVRDPAITGLAGFHDAAVTQKMKLYLADKTSRRRRRTAIAYLSNPLLGLNAVTLLPLVHDKDPEVRLDVVEAILGMPGNGAKAQLVYLLNDPQKDIRLTLLKKMPLFLKLPKIKKGLLKKSLTRLLKDPDPEIQSLAKKYLPVAN